jgi:hypothetical protein
LPDFALPHDRFAIEAQEARYHHWIYKKRKMKIRSKIRSQYANEKRKEKKRKRKKERTKIFVMRKMRKFWPYWRLVAWGGGAHIPIWDKMVHRSCCQVAISNSIFSVTLPEKQSRKRKIEKRIKIQREQKKYKKQIDWNYIASASTDY